jgi:hypothetical protein
MSYGTSQYAAASRVTRIVAQPDAATTHPCFLVFDPAVMVSQQMHLIRVADELG